MEIAPAETDLREQLEILVEEWSAAAAEKGLNLNCAFAANLPGSVFTDPLQLEMVLSILLSNAIKFTESGEIRIRARGAHVGSAHIAITDTGAGLPPELVAAIFDTAAPVEQIAARGARNLIIARRIVAALGGDIAAASPPSGGSAFLIVLPEAPPGRQIASRVAPQLVDIGEETPEAAEAQAPAPSADLATFQVLAADDNPMSRMVVESLLERIGCTPVMADDGGQALEAVLARAYDAIILDRQMPVYDGLEVARRLRESGPNEKTPVIALTANARAADRDEWRAAGADAVLAKPLQASELVETLRKLSPAFREDNLGGV